MQSEHDQCMILGNQQGSVVSVMVAMINISKFHVKQVPYASSARPHGSLEPLGFVPLGHTWEWIIQELRDR